MVETQRCKLRDTYVRHTHWARLCYVPFLYDVEGHLVYSSGVKLARCEKMGGGREARPPVLTAISGSQTINNNKDDSGIGYANSRVRVTSAVDGTGMHRGGRVQAL